MVPALYDDGEKEALASGVRDAAVAAGADDSREGLWRFFVERCRANLHVVLAMSPVGETLRTRCRWGWGGGAGARRAGNGESIGEARCRKLTGSTPPLPARCRRARNFPGLVNNTVIDWFEPWPEQVGRAQAPPAPCKQPACWMCQAGVCGSRFRPPAPPPSPFPAQALESVASVFLAEEDLPPPMRAGIAGHMVCVHQSVRAFSAKFEAQLRRHNYVTVRGWRRQWHGACGCTLAPARLTLANGKCA
jgi:dynein heavy chain